MIGHREVDIGDMLTLSADFFVGRQAKSLPCLVHITLKTTFELDISILFIHGKWRHRGAQIVAHGCSDIQEWKI